MSEVNERSLGQESGVSGRRGCRWRRGVFVVGEQNAVLRTAAGEFLFGCEYPTLTRRARSGAELGLRPRAGARNLGRLLDRAELLAVPFSSCRAAQF